MKRQHAWPLVLVLTLLLVGCGGGGGAQFSTPWTRVEREVFVVGQTGPSIDRRFIVYLPPGYSDGVPRPVIFGFHGAFGTPEDFVDKSDLPEADGANRFILVFPRGYRFSWNVGPCCGAARDVDIDEIAFVRAMLDDVQALSVIDRNRVYATGFSNGAMLAYHLACEISGEIAAIGPVGAAMQDSADDCTPLRPVPVLHLHGLVDDWAPYNGGPSVWDELAPQPSIPSVIDIWVAKNGCQVESQRQIPGQVICQVHSGCDGGGDVVLCPVSDLGHQWPGDDPAPISELEFGPGRPDVPASDAILEFFREQPAVN